MAGENYSYGSADLQKVLPDRLTVVHGVEGCDLVDAHRGHLKHASDFVHNADASVSVLALTEVEQGHHGRLLVLRRVALKDLIGEGEVLLGEGERESRVVGRGIAVLDTIIIVSYLLSFRANSSSNWCQFAPTDA